MDIDVGGGEGNEDGKSNHGDEEVNHEDVDGGDGNPDGENGESYGRDENIDGGNGGGEVHFDPTICDIMVEEY